VRKTRYPRARLYGAVRSAHLERARVLPPASILHRRWRYDLDPSLTEGLDLIRGGSLAVAVTVLRSGLTGLEVVEPMMRPLLARTAMAIACARLSGALRRRPVSVVSYAIDNQDEYALETAPSWRRRLRLRVDRALTRYVARQTDRIVFGTAAAADLYESVLGEELAGATSTVIPALPAACTCPPVDADPDLVLFVGAFQGRKGLPELLAAWPEVVRRRPSARLTVVGKGPLEDLARDLAARVDGVDVVVDPPRTEIHRLQRRAAVAVLLSRRTATWREQVGLPLVEGLAHGCAVVTTQETGLADWLAAHGHDVLSDPDDPDQVAGVIVRALDRRRAGASVLADLPDEDGRLAADRWLFGTGSSVRPTAALRHAEC
jgi:glycosyltransferase involved in cell wall biosynthesis